MTFLFQSFVEQIVESLWHKEFKIFSTAEGTRNVIILIIKCETGESFSGKIK